MENYTSPNWNKLDCWHAVGLAIALVLAVAINGCGAAEAGDPRTPGERGPQGPAGEPGDPGVDGADGQDCTAEAVAGQVLISCGDFQTVLDFPEAVPGPQGEEGPAGPEGPAGQDGSDGVDGTDGQEAGRIVYSLTYVEPMHMGDPQPGEAVRFDRQNTGVEGLVQIHLLQTRRLGYCREQRDPAPVEVQVCDIQTRSSVTDTFPGCPGPGGFGDYVPCEFPIPANTGGETVVDQGCSPADFVEVWEPESDCFRTTLVDSFARVDLGYDYSFHGPGPEYDAFITAYFDGEDLCGFHGEPNWDGSWWSCGAGSVDSVRITPVEFAVVRAVDLDGDLSRPYVEPGVAQ